MIACLYFASKYRQEESPGYSETGFRLTGDESNLRDSATESKPPAHILGFKIWAGKGETAV